MEVLTQQLPPSNWLGQAFLALALHHCREREEAGQGGERGMGGGRRMAEGGGGREGDGGKDKWERRKERG